jgi:CBS domain-containing protein
MTRDVVTARPDETVASVARKMSDNGISCVVVAEGHRIKGIFTERDLVRGIARDGEGDGHATMSQRMSSPVATIALDVPVVDAAELMESKAIKRVPVVSGGEMVGIVTQTDITRGLALLCPLRFVSDIMSGDVASVEATQTVAEAAQVMSERDISCLVAMRDGIAVGMLTEKDLAKYVIAAEHKPSETLVVDVMSFPVHWVPPSCSVLSANQKMSAMRLHRLLVMDGASLRGVVSQRDIMRAVRSEFERVDADRTAALSAITEHVLHIRSEVAELRDFLSSCSNEADGHESSDAAAGHGSVAAGTASRIQHIMDELGRL